MKTRRLNLIVAGLVVLVAAASLAQAGEASKTNAPAKAAYGSAAMTDGVKSVYTNYFKIEEALSEDSLKDVPTYARAIVSTVTNDVKKLMPVEVATQAEELAKAKELPEAREAFKVLTASLIHYLDDRDVRTKSYNEMFCPMANAIWLQKADDETKNPYLGKSMPQCGTINRTL